MSFDNIGKPVTSERMACGEKHLREMMPEASSGDRLRILTAFVERIERDEPAALLSKPQPEYPVGLLDVTDRYRLFAALLAEQEVA